MKDYTKIIIPNYTVWTNRRCSVCTNKLSFLERNPKSTKIAERFLNFWRRKCNCRKMSSIVWINTHSKDPESKHRSKRNTKRNTSLLNLLLAKTLEYLLRPRLIAMHWAEAKTALHVYGSELTRVIPILPTVLARVQWKDHTKGSLLPESRSSNESDWMWSYLIGESMVKWMFLCLNKELLFTVIGHGFRWIATSMKNRFKLHPQHDNYG